MEPSGGILKGREAEGPVFLVPSSLRDTPTLPPFPPPAPVTTGTPVWPGGVQDSAVCVVDTVKERST